MIDYGTIERLLVNAGPSTTLAMTGSADYTVNPGAETDQGEVLSGGVPVTFDGFGSGETLALTGTGAGTLTDNGTAANDVFNVSTNTVTIAGRVTITATALPTATLNAYAGDDVFNVNGNNTFTTLNINGGDGDDDDTLVLTNRTSAATVNLGLRTVAGYGALINYTGLQTIDANAGAAALAVVATAEDDDVTVTVWDANSGTVQLGLAVQQNGQVQGDSVDPLVIYRNTGGNAVAVNLSGGEDTLVVVGNALSQTFNINIPAGSVTVDDGNNASIDGTVTWTNNESLEVFGLESDDTFNVVAGAIPLFIDGGDPIGQTAGDKFNMLAGGGAVIFQSGPEPDEGGILVGANARISYDHIEAGQVTDFDCAVIMGTNGDDDITIIARTQLANPLRYATADGNKDFTSTVNDGIEVLWVNNVAADATVNLYVDALSGDDDVVFRTPAIDPVSGNPIAWNVHAWVVGGTPSAVTGDQGDVFELETPGPTSVVYQPLTSETGTLSVNTTSNAGGPYDTMIHLVQSFVVACTTGQVNEYASSEGGFEELVYDGETGNDRLTIVATPPATIPSSTPRAGRDEGTVRVNETAGRRYQNLGSAAVLTVDGAGQPAVPATGWSRRARARATSWTVGRDDRRSDAPRSS